MKEQRKFRQDDNPGRHLSLPDYEHALGASTCSKCKLFLSAVHHQQLNRERLTEQALCRADLEREFHVAFQPIKDTHREQTVAFEALARWESPELGSVPPNELIPITECIGLVNSLTLALLLRLGTEQITAHEAFTPDPEDIHVQDTRPQIRLDLDCELHGQRFEISLGPLTCEELFSALDLPAHHVACWLSEDDWRQLLGKRWITIACTWRRRKAILTNQIYQDRRILLICFLSVSLFALTVILSLLQR